MPKGKTSAAAAVKEPKKIKSKENSIKLDNNKPNKKQAKK
jgi:hypothetical protein